MGWKLKIPTSKKYAPLKKKPRPTPVSLVKGNYKKYVVQRGDSLWKVANQFGTTTEVIKSLNQLNNTRLQIGQVIMIPEELAL
jgi:LysM repeat protein